MLRTDHIYHGAKITFFYNQDYYLVITLTCVVPNPIGHTPSAIVSPSIHTWSEKTETWEEKQNYAILLRKERSLKDFKYFADLLDKNKIPIITTIDNR